MRFGVYGGGILEKYTFTDGPCRSPQIIHNNWTTRIQGTGNDTLENSSLSARIYNTQSSDKVLLHLTMNASSGLQEAPSLNATDLKMHQLKKVGRPQRQQLQTIQIDS